ncbi:hypothetical protein CONLIGDRAFT_556837, partial [Coniochaeta ligniaria NRRL 30616]
DEWEYEYSTTETETYYLTLDLSVRDFLDKIDENVLHSTRAGYRVWFNPVKSGNDDENLEVDDDANGPKAPNPTGNDDDDEDEDNDPLSEAVRQRRRPQTGSNVEEQPKAATSDRPAETMQIMELHTPNPLVSYRGMVFRGSWAENIGTEMVFARHESEGGLQVLRNLPENIDLLSASSTRINFKEVKLEVRGQETSQKQTDREWEEAATERYRENGGVYVHVGSDKHGFRRPQANFLEDLTVLKRKRGETDAVTITTVETTRNDLFHDDLDEVQRRKKIKRDRARNRNLAMLSGAAKRGTRGRGARRTGRAKGRGPPRGPGSRSPTVFLLSLVLILTILPGILNPTPPSKQERERDKQWVSTSPYWLDRQACRWLMVCGVHHVRWDAPTRPDNTTDDDGDELKRTDLRRRRADTGNSDERPNSQAWTSTRRFQDGTARRDARTARDIPDYVLKYAPLVHLYSGEHFWPSDIADFVRHMDPLFANGSAAGDLSRPLDLDNLGDLLGDDDESEGEEEVYLTSQVDVETRPEWLHSYRNTPVPFGNDSAGGGGDEAGQGRKAQGGSNTYSPVPLDKTTWWSVDKKHPIHRISDPRKVSPRRRARRPLSPRQQHVLGATAMHKPDGEGYSKAPAVLVMVDKGSGILDAFWFFFYGYNLGQTVAGVRFGNHVGDWEHSMIRFEDGVPRALFCSEHAGGKAYLWGALEKRKTKSGGAGEGEKEKVERPVVYSAVGSHAMYADAGRHPYVLPFGLLKDVTDRGPLWDPSLNTYAYFYDYEAEAGGNRTSSLVPAASNPEAPTSWFHFAGPWGDELYPLADRRQWRLFGQYHYITGPQGPKFKKLDREKVCQTERCTIVTSIEAGKKMAWY